MSKKRKVATRLIAVFIAAIILGSAVRVGMYYFEYRQDSKILHYLKENESKSVFRGLVNDDGKPYQQKTVRYDIDGDGKKEIVYAGYDELGSGYPRYVICSITSSGFTKPPEAKISHKLSILFFNSPVII